MSIHHISLRQIPDLEASCCCIGNFDGVHIGHQELIKETIRQAGLLKTRSAALLFSPDPSDVIFPQRANEHLTSINERISLMKSFGIQEFYVLDFDQEFMKLPASDTVSFLNKLNIRILICGFDFSYGYKAQGNPQILKNDVNREFGLKIIDEVQINNVKVSSSLIIPMIRKGQINGVLHQLNHDYRVAFSSHDGIIKSFQGILPDNGTYKVRVNDADHVLHCENGSFRFPDGLTADSLMIFLSDSKVRL